jgi:glucosamine 6-phosphate synthetase-like amidotransferase/phosphosugar isomerase protein
MLPLGAGPERSVAATKTYSNQVAALALLAGHAAGRGREFADGSARRRPARASAAGARAQARAIALPFASVGRMFVIGRGIEFATAARSR